MKLKNLLIVLLALLLCASCKVEDQSTPEYATKEFLKSFNTGDFTNVYKYTPAKEHIIIEQLEKMMNENKEQFDKVKKNRLDITSVTCTEQTDSTAVCHCKYSLNGKVKEQDMNLKKEDGHWCVKLSL
ncbi:MAG: DUF4878 domain-containing protein [Bacteroidales bacterium]|nr:DUF4878 domain-containing protein [Bacteroidales bacterium]MBO7647368.1 DUF4878 domain-containing protein [Bacteroidales bacterium]